MDEANPAGPAVCRATDARPQGRLVAGVLGRQLFDRNPAVLLLVDADEGLVLDANLAAASWYGLPRLELQGAPLARITCTPRPTLLARLRAVSAAGDGTFQARHRRADGDERDVEVCASAVTDGTRPLLFVVIHDITSRRQLAEELARRDRLEVLRAVSGGIAHDFNNVLTTVCGNVEVAREMLRDDDGAGVDEVLADIASAARSATGLTRKLLGFTAQRAPRLEPMRACALVEAIVQFHLRGSAVGADVDVSAGLPSILADAAQLHQVFGNLVLNARQVMQDRGRLHVRARAVDVAGGPDSPLPAGRFVLVSVRDHGPGIPADVLTRVFDPFFTTKPDGQGLGLASCLHIVQQHGGHIAVDNPPGGGARFRVWLPVAPAAPLPLEAAAAPRATAAVRRALVLDDQPGVRRMLVRLGRRVGLDVTAVAHADEAVDAVRDALEDGAPFSVALLDLTIPGGPGGHEVAPRLRALHPELALVAMTGHPESGGLHRPSEYGFDGGLAKPFTIDAFSQLVLGLLLEGEAG